MFAARWTLRAAFFAASNEFISFPLHSFARHQHTEWEIGIERQRVREWEKDRYAYTQRHIERHCGRNFIGLWPQALARTIISALLHRAHKLELQRVDDDIPKCKVHTAQRRERAIVQVRVRVRIWIWTCSGVTELGALSAHRVRPRVQSEPFWHFRVPFRFAVRC